MTLSTKQTRAILVKDKAGPVDNLYLGETPAPRPNKGQLQVKVKCFSVNRMDVAQREGQYALPPNAPEILGVEFSGTVSEKGEGVSEKWNIGDEVFGLTVGGAYAEYVVVEETLLIGKPKHLSWSEAASIPEVFATAYQGVVLHGDLQVGESILIHAATTGEGIAAIQIARIIGAKNIIATASTKEELAHLLHMPNGATHAVDYKSQDFAEEVKKITESKGVNVIVDFVGRPHWDKNIDSLGIDGRMTVFADMSGNTVPEGVDLLPVFVKGLKIQGSTLRSRSIEYQSDLLQRLKNDIVGKITGKDGEGPIKTYVHNVYDWKDIQDAHREVEANKHFGKIVVEVV